MPAMTREAFEARAVRDAEKRLGVPSGWWGTWQDVHGPGQVRVKFTGGVWTIYQLGERVSRHDSRTFAITKARRLVRP